MRVESEGIPSGGDSGPSAGARRSDMFQLPASEGILL